MRQINQDPRDYRADPVKGEPVFVQGGARRLGLWALGLGISLAITVPVYFLVSPVAEWATNLILGR